MASSKAIRLLFVLSLSLLWPPEILAQSQAEQPPAAAPEQTVELEFHPLASFLTTMNIPARGILCGLTGVMAGVVMAASAGTRYGEAAKMIEESCSGPWVITPEMIEESRKKEKEPTPDALRDLGKP